MSLVEKTIWLIESRLDAETSLADLAAQAGVSRFHLSRAFGAVTGRSVMTYLRGRRLSEAARKLAAGSPDILTVALEAGYGSHEAFTRAFREQFGLTPEAARAKVDTVSLELVPPLALEPTADVAPASPRFEDHEALMIAGLGERYTFETNTGIPFKWRRFTPYIETLTHRADRATYGVCCNRDDDGRFDYVAGAAVTSFADLPAELLRLRLPAQRYAVFTHSDHVGSLRRTVRAIWTQWLPASGCRLADAPDFERYDEAFDAMTGQGGCEIWLPVEAAS